MYKKRRISFVVIIAVVLSLLSILTACTTTGKIPIPTVRENVYIYDDDNVIDDDVEKRLNQMLVELEEKTEVEFAVISIQSLLDRSIEEYSNNVFNTLGIGKKGKDNGLLLLFSKSDARVRLEIGRGLEGCLNDAKCGRILDNHFVPYRETDEYTKATDLTVNAILAVLAEEYNIDIEGLEKNLAQENPSVEDADKLSFTGMIITFLLLVIVIIALAVILALFSDGSSGGSWSGSSGGSFGGGFSGGFGGGFSGGGGASR